MTYCMPSEKSFHSPLRETRAQNSDRWFLSAMKLTQAYPGRKTGLSGIPWGGWDNFFYLFTYEDTRDAFSIPHDIRILEEVSVLVSLSLSRSDSSRSFVSDPLTRTRNGGQTDSESPQPARTKPLPTSPRARCTAPTTPFSLPTRAPSCSP